MSFRNRLFAGVALASLSAMPRRMAEEAAQEEGGTALPEGVTQEGGTTRVVGNAQESGPEAPAQDEAPVKPEGLSEEDWTTLQEAKAAKAKPADETKVETQGKEGEETKTGIDLLVAQQTEGMKPETAAVVGPLVREFAEKGDLTPEGIKAAAEATGLSETIVKQYVENAKAANSEAVAQANAPFFALVGGQENAASFVEWANEALGPEDHAKINQAQVDGKPDAVQPFVDAWKASGRAPAPRDLTTGAQGDNGAQVDTDVFTSRAEQTKVVNSAKYRNDPAYRAKMEAKIGRSNV